MADDTREKHFQSILDQVVKHQDHFTKELKILRPNNTCKLTIPTLQKLIEDHLRSCYNLHILITFDDGVKWLLRIRQRTHHRPPTELVLAELNSEIATLNVLNKTGLPVPKAYSPLHLDGKMSDDNEVPPLDYFYYEFMKGKPCKVEQANYYGSIDLPEEELKQFIEEYAKLQIQISNIKLPYKQIGSIYPSKVKTTHSKGKKIDDTEIGPFIARGSFMNPSPPYLLGPFTTQKERYLAHIDTTLRYISIEALYEEGVENGIDEYLWHLELRELVSASKRLEKIPQRLYIKHADEKGDHLMMNDKQDVIGVLDWQWAYVTTKSEAFSTPYIFNRRLFYERGSNGFSKEEGILVDSYNRLGRPDLGKCVKAGKIYTRLGDIGHYSKANKKSGYRDVFGKDKPADLTPPEDDVDWRVYMMKRHADNQGLRDYMQKFEWTIEKAEEAARLWHVEEQEKREQKGMAREEVKTGEHTKVQKSHED
ncbi:uncharacterized protein L201_003064 [Kwoniella dendrophila CBS 6074]|uniref:Aminoglycoside phosphotransferase domain-containing protein n=1 Tax=Kwoniella dendrophila CBS 6074 TaxID=1295534 RepID=A0AAX4JTB8_9TREE